MKLKLSDIVPALPWVLCVNESSPECHIHVQIECDVQDPVLAALYLAAKATLDYRVAAAMHIYMKARRVTLAPDEVVKLERCSKVETRVPKAIEDGEYAWEYVFYRGLVYAQSLLDAERLVVVKVDGCDAESVARMYGYKHLCGPYILVKKRLIPEISRVCRVEVIS